MAKAVKAVKATPITKRNTIELKYSDLIVDEQNVRKITTDVKDLAENIASIGLIKNLVVRELPNKKYGIVAGSRRFAAITHLNDNNRWEKSQTITCQICSDDEVLDISLSENFHRQALNPADEAMAFKAHIDDGKDIPKIAQIHGVSETVVKKRLKLAALSPTVLEALRNDEITLHQAQAFALSDNHEQQDEIYQQIAKRPSYWQSHEIRNMITKEEYETDHRYVVFVGLENYIQSGGKIREDLFAEEQYIQDPELLLKLANEKMEKTKAQFEADGWSWVQEHDSSYFYSLTGRYRRLTAKKEKQTDEQIAALKKATEELHNLREIEDKTDEIRQQEQDKFNEVQSLKPKDYYTDKMKSYSGVVFAMDYNGELVIEHGWVKPSDDPVIQKNKAKLEKQREERGEPEKPQTSAKLLTELSHVNWSVLKLELLKNPEVAADLFIFESFMSLQQHSYVFEITLREYNGHGSRSEVDILGTSTVLDQATEIIDSIDMNWYDIKDQAKSFIAFRKLTDEHKKQVMSWIAATTLYANTKEISDNKSLQSAIEEMNVDIREHWNPTEAYFKKLKTNDIFLITEDIMSPDYANEARAEKKKKSQIVTDMHNLFDPENSYGGKNAKANAAKWCPSEIKHN